MKISFVAPFVALLTLGLPAHSAGTCPNWLGYAMLKASWPTPEYTSCEFERVEPKGNGVYHILMKATGASRVSLVDDKEVWVRVGATVSIPNRKIVSFEVRDYRAMFAPGATYSTVNEILESNR